MPERCKLFVALSLLLLCWGGLGVGKAAASETFEAWVQEFKVQARAAGVSEETLHLAFKNVAFLPRVVELDRRQPEFTLTLEGYLSNAVSSARIRIGHRKMREHAALLDEVYRYYGVPPRLIVALWGIETSYGSNQGAFPIIDSLATLAYDGRRAALFSKELLSALKILDQGHIALEAFKGSWAGAMGQSQFMPSSFLEYARDFDGDQRIDIWHSMPDVFASMANYLARNGWQANHSWGMEVQRPSDWDEAMVSRKKHLPLSRWQALGFTLTDGSNLPVKELPARLVVPNAQSPRSFLALSNYDVLLRWNRSDYFAIAVGKLSDALAETERELFSAKQ